MHPLLEILFFPFFALLGWIDKVQSKKTALQEESITEAAAKEKESKTITEKALIGKLGMTVTAMRPEGIISVDGERLIARSHESFIQPNTAIWISGFKDHVPQIKQNKSNK